MSVNVRGIVLAAGDSTRMGAPKALLPDGEGRVFITRLLHTFRDAGVSDVTIVTGSMHDRLVHAVASDPARGALVRFARNPDPSRGQLSSLLAGLDAASVAGLDAVLMIPVDVPFVSAGTVRAVVEAFERKGASVVRPANGSRHGHPVLLAAAVFAEIRRADPAQGAKAVVRAHQPLNVEVDDEGAFVDVDTPADYERLVKVDRRDRETP